MNHKRQSFVFLTILAGLILVFFQNCGDPSLEGMQIELHSEESPEEALQRMYRNFETLPNDGDLDETRARMSEYLVRPPSNQQLNDYSEEHLKPIFRFQNLKSGRFLYGKSQYFARDEGVEDEVLYEGIAFNIFYKQLSDSRRLYLCRDTENSTEYLSTDEFCEPSPSRSFVENVRGLGYIATQYTEGARAKLFRCFNEEKQAYMASLYRSECELADGYEVEGILGYVSEGQKDQLKLNEFRSTRLNRFRSLEGEDRILSIEVEKSDFEIEKSFSISSFNLGAMISIYTCFDNVTYRHFESRDPNCEVNASFNTGEIKYISSIKTRDFNKALYRCKFSAGRSYFTTTDFNCESKDGYSAELVFGYVADQ